MDCNADKYGFNLTLYDSPPEGFENMSRLEEMAQARLNLYKILQENTCTETVPDKDFVDCLNQSIFRFLLKEGNSRIIREVRRIDDKSHWILRLAYSRHQDLRRLFVQYELEWFKIRFKHMSKDIRLSYLEKHNLTLPKISDEEKSHLNSSVPHFDLENDVIYNKADFTEVLPLVRTRNYFLNEGTLYFPESEIIHYLENIFEYKLNQGLVHSKKILETTQHEQLETLLSRLTLLKPSFNYQMTLSSFENIDEIAIKNFPLCMRVLHENLRKTHHLKYFGRMQYGLFIKSLGVSFDDYLNYWRDEFTNTMTEQKFIQKYSYLFKHQYGTVGRKISQSPYSCEKIIGQAVGPGQVYGCPYKHWDGEILKNYLTKSGISSQIIDVVLRDKEKSLFTQACTKCFEFENRCEPEGFIITHPNQYFHDSFQEKNKICDIEDIFCTEYEDCVL